MGDNINPQRLAVTGYADQRPAASNTSDAGRAQNRRVEVLILPSTIRTASSGSAAAPAPSRTQKAAELPNKDATATVNTAPALPNK
jgi:chemotaxis protein MotB